MRPAEASLLPGSFRSGFVLGNFQLFSELQTSRVRAAGVEKLRNPWRFCEENYNSEEALLLAGGARQGGSISTLGDTQGP
jgi:hypothetical protein